MESNAANFSYTFNDIINDPGYNDLVKELGSEAELKQLNIADENEYYRQLGELYRSASEKVKNTLVNNVTQYIKQITGPKQEYMVNLQLCHWFRTDINLGIIIAKYLDLDLSETMKQMR
jgi:catalase